MKTKQIIDTLQAHNDWRRDKINATDYLDSITAHEIGMTIDAAIDQLGELEGVKLRLAAYQRKYDDAIAYEYEVDRKLERQIEQLKKERDEANAVEYSDLLANWAAKRSRLDAEYAKLKCLFGADPECSPVKAMYDTFGHYTKVLAKLVGDDDGWLDWYSWENDNGAAKLEAKASNWQEPKPIVTTDDLLFLIANDKDSHAN